LLALAGSSELFGAEFDCLLKFLKPMFETSNTLNLHFGNK